MRLVTRADLDGLTCGVLLTRCERIDAIELVQPQDVAQRRLPIGPDDVLTNLPYHPGCGLWFDNHLLTDARSTPPAGFRGRYAQAPSAARVVYEHYLPTHPELARHETLLAETDRLDSAQLTLQDVVSPEGYVLLGFTLDARSGLGDPREYFLRLLPAVRDLPLAEVLALPEVRERVSALRERDQAFRGTALAHSRLEGEVVVTDFRPLPVLPVGNRFLVFTLFPQASVALRVQSLDHGTGLDLRRPLDLRPDLPRQPRRAALAPRRRRAPGGRRLRGARGGGRRARGRDRRRAQAQWLSFGVGVNLPWIDYGQDFGASAWRPQGGVAQPDLARADARGAREARRRRGRAGALVAARRRARRPAARRGAASSSASTTPCSPTWTRRSTRSPEPGCGPSSC